MSGIKMKVFGVLGAAVVTAAAFSGVASAKPFKYYAGPFKSESICSRYVLNEMGGFPYECVRVQGSEASGMKSGWYVTK
ncbi:hypothetical protein AB0N81_30145 [Streptomyces sp. NPDC093510]|uniref:hypothetical protein n=1 Tax=Streptomyces sp. NPDC093510 TaxID=3155199 RepID=UPI0034249AF6